MNLGVHRPSSTKTSGCIVTVDAMGTQKKIAREIIEADADFVLVLKGNHETVHAEVKTYLDETVAETAQPRPVGAKLSPAAARLAAGNPGEGSRTD